MVIIAQNYNSRLPTSTDCKTLKAELGVSDPVVYDAVGRLSKLTTDSNLNIVTDESLTILFKKSYAPLTELEEAVQDALE